MATFEDLELSPEVVEALAAEGMETATALQEALIPLVRRGNNVVAVAGPGSGVLAAFAAPLLERIEPDGGGPGILILVPTSQRADGLAESVARLALATGHRVAALDPLWVLPERARVLVGTPEAVQRRITGGQLSLEEVQAVVLDSTSSMASADQLPVVQGILEGVSPDVQRVVVTLPLSPQVEAFVEAHARRSVHVPPRAGAAGSSPHRGELSVVEYEGTQEAATLRAVAHLLREARHVAVFARGEDVAADLGDHLSLRGYAAGRPGDAEVPVWLATGEIETRQLLDGSDSEDVVILSADVPGDADMLDRRHGGGRGGVVLARPRELPHLEAVAREAGYGTRTAAIPAAAEAPSSVSTLLAALESALDEDDVDAYRLLLEPLFERFGASSVAAAAVALLRRRKPAVASPDPATVGVPGWVRLFISVGKRDNVRPGDLVGAITGEARVEAEQVGRIDLRDSYSLVEVEQRVAQQVIDALNGSSIRGRAARVDYHREDRGGGRGGGPGRGSRSPRSGSPPRRRHPPRDAD